MSSNHVSILHTYPISSLHKIIASRLDMILAIGYILLRDWVMLLHFYLLLPNVKVRFMSTLFILVFIQAAVHFIKYGR